MAVNGMLGAMLREPIKLVVLILLVVQTVAMLLLIRVSRTRDGPKYLPSTAVWVAECVKCCAAVVGVRVQAGSWDEAWSIIRVYVFERYQSTLLLAIPSLLYVLQNNLLYIAINNLPAAVYQITYQLKIFTTVMFSMLMFGTRVSRQKWVALTLLMIGIIVVQLDTMPKSSSPKNVATPPPPPAAHTLSERDAFAWLDSTALRFGLSLSSLKGLAAVMCACLTAGGAGVYSEGILKNTSAASTTSVPQRYSIWIRNIQFALFGIIASYITAYIKDGESIAEVGWFYGWDALVVLIVCFQSWGGFLVAVVVKYTDSITKGFASALSVVSVGAMSAILFDFKPTVLFLGGSVIVIIATFLYFTDSANTAANPPGKTTDDHRSSSTTADEEVAGVATTHGSHDEL